MKLDVKITNLGRLEAGAINIRPMTVLTEHAKSEDGSIESADCQALSKK